MRSRIFSGSLKSVRVNQLLWPVSLLCLCCVGEVSAIPLRLSYSVVGPSVAGVWMGQETGTFKKYGLDVQLIYIPFDQLSRMVKIGRQLTRRT